MNWPEKPENEEHYLEEAQAPVLRFHRVDGNMIGVPELIVTAAYTTWTRVA